MSVTNTGISYNMNTINLTENLLRICPGRHFSDNSLYLTASCLLAVYDIKPPVDDQGNAIVLNPEFTTSLLV